MFRNACALFCAMLGVLPATISTSAAAEVAVSTASSVTYAEHVAPIINQHCISCHRPGFGAPFTLMNYEEARKKGKQMAHVAERRQMPPWKPERGYEKFVGERGMSEVEIATLAAWVAQGMPEGDPALTPPIPAFPASGWRLGTPDIVVEMRESFEVPASGPDLYRNFVIPLPDFPEGKWVKGIEFKASAPSVVHHCLIDVDTRGRGRVLDEMDPGPGFEAMDQQFEDSRIAGYAVGSLPYFLPEGAYYKIAPGTDLILESHFHPSGKAEVERSQVAFYLTDEPPTRELVPLQIPPAFGMTLALDIPPGESHYVARHQYTVPKDVLVYHIFPHAHSICREMKSVATLPDGTVKTLLWIKDWDFSWQEQYVYADPPLLPAGTVIDMTWVYDNSSNNPFNPNDPIRRVTWGPSSKDEMGSLGISVIPVDPAMTEPLKDAHFAYMKQEFRNLPQSYLEPLIASEILRRFDTNRNGWLGPLEVRHMAAWWVTASRMNRGQRSWEIEEIIMRRGAVPYLRSYGAQVFRYGAAAGAGLGLLLLGLFVWLFLRWRARRTAREQMQAV